MLCSFRALNDPHVIYNLITVTQIKITASSFVLFNGTGSKKIIWLSHKTLITEIANWLTITTGT